MNIANFLIDIKYHEKEKDKDYLYRVQKYQNGLIEPISWFSRKNCIKNK